MTWGEKIKVEINENNLRPSEPNTKYNDISDIFWISSKNLGNLKWEINKQNNIQENDCTDCHKSIYDREPLKTDYQTNKDDLKFVEKDAKWNIVVYSELEDIKKLADLWNKKEYRSYLLELDNIQNKAL